MIEIQLNIFSKGSIITPEEIEWEEIKIEKSPINTFLDYEKNLKKSNIKFDKLRYCELENIIHLWKGEQSLTIKKSVEEFRRIFSKIFKINSILYDFAKFYIFKVKIVANVKGTFYLII